MSPNPFSAKELYNIYLKHPSVVTDSRSVTEGSLFIALRGEKFNGNMFAAESLDKGAAYAVVDDAGLCYDERYIFVNDALRSLQELSRLHRSALRAKVIGITGSNGKTTTKELIHAILSLKYNTVATKGNLNNHIGVPLTILSADNSTEILVVEMGANHVGEIALLCEIANPSYGIITNIGKAHLEGFGSPEGVVKAKGELYDFLGRNRGSTIIVNASDHLLYRMASEAGVGLFSYGTSSDADVKGEPTNINMFLNLNWYSKGLKREVKTRLAGGYNFTNVMAAIASGVVMGVDEDLIVQAVEYYEPANNRSQYHETGNNRVIIDCYNANPASMKEAIDYFLSNNHKPGCLILGDMLELGSYADTEHRIVADMVKGSGNMLICVGKHFSATCYGVADHIFKDTDELTLWLKNKPLRGFNILLKGSRGIGLERVLDYL